MIAAARRIDRLKGLADSDARIHPVARDVSLAADRTRLAETALATTGRIDILVNNAATSGETCAEDESLDAFADVLGVNLTAPYHPGPPHRRGARPHGRQEHHQRLLHPRPGDRRAPGRRELLGVRPD